MTDTDPTQGRPEEVSPVDAGGASPEDLVEPAEAVIDPAAPLPPADPPLVEEGPPGPSGNQGDPADDLLATTQMELAERTADLQRLQAEFVNYKRRVERDRELIKQNATFAALTPIVEVLDTVDLAREHGELQGGFKSVAEQLERVVARQGLTRFGAPGDAFDPNLHEALSHIGTDPEVTVTTCQHIAKVGYRIGDRVVRAAQVLVVDPAE